MTKNKYTGVIVLIIAVIAAIIIFDPFGSKIEGEWYVYYVEVDGESGSLRQDSTESMPSFNFSDDGTVTMAYQVADYSSYNGTKYSYDTATYSYSKGKLALDGDVFDCKISGDKMTLSGEVNGKSLKFELKR